MFLPFLLRTFHLALGINLQVMSKFGEDLLGYLRAGQLLRRLEPRHDHILARYGWRQGVRIVPESGMDYDRGKVDEMVLALLWLAQAGDGRAWKSHDWDAMERLHEKGFISDPKSKAKSVIFSEEGERRARELFEQHFGSK